MLYVDPMLMAHRILVHWNFIHVTAHVIYDVQLYLLTNIYGCLGMNCQIYFNLINNFNNGYMEYLIESNYNQVTIY